MLNLSELNVHHKKRGDAPDAACCRRCGTWSGRNEVRSRYFWEGDLRSSTVIEVELGCYICPNCPVGERWFTNLPAEYRTSKQYSISSRQIVVDLVQRHRMSIEGAAAVGREVLNLPKLNATTVLGWFREAGGDVDVAARQEEGVKVFSGQMAIDEVYDGDWYQLKATDPLNDIELAWSIGEGSPSEADIREFLEGLKRKGFEPLVVVTDGSNLYPKVINEVWPEAKHQRCVFHFIKQINDDLRSAFWAAYQTMPKPPKRKRGRPKKRGRPRKDKEKRENRRKVRLARFLLLKRESQPDGRDRFTERERAALEEAIALCPPLGVLRRFVVQLHELFGPTTDIQVLAEERRQAMLNDPEFSDTKGLATAMKRLSDDDLFERLTRYLDFENAEKTSNHVERENREYRKRQKTHYRLRSLASVCALLDLLTVRKSIPRQPTKLLVKPPPEQIHEEVRRAA